MMKGLMQRCCQCNVIIENNTIHLWCSCLIALCASCGLQQLTTKPNTYHSHITCPVCGNEETSVTNGIIEGVQEAESLEQDLIKNACTFFHEPHPSFQKNTWKLFPLYQDLLVRFAKLGYPPLLENAGIKHKDVAALHVARCEAQREQTNAKVSNSNSFSESNGKLALGPLLMIKFKAHHTLEKVLKIVDGKDNANHLSKTCESCDEDLTPGSTVRSFCKCYNSACQLCQRRALKNYKKTFAESPIKCLFCNGATIPVGNIDAAKKYQDQLLQRNPAYKKTNKVDELWIMYCEFATSCNMKQSIPYYDFIEPRNAELGQGSNNLHTKPMCFLEMARMEVERTRRAAARVPKKEKSDVSNLPLGPLARLDIARNLVLETFLTFQRGGEVREAQMKETRVTRSAEPQPLVVDPSSLFDEVQGRVRSKVASGGELSAVVRRRIEKGAATEATRNWTLLLRTQSTPCPHEGCTVNPYCPVYLKQHIQSHHKIPAPVVSPISAKRGGGHKAAAQPEHQQERGEEQSSSATAARIVPSQTPDSATGDRSAMPSSCDADCIDLTDNAGRRPTIVVPFQNTVAASTPVSTTSGASTSANPVLSSAAVQNLRRTIKRKIEYLDTSTATCSAALGQATAASNKSQPSTTAPPRQEFVNLGASPGLAPLTADCPPTPSSTACSDGESEDSFVSINWHTEEGTLVQEEGTSGAPLLDAESALAATYRAYIAAQSARAEEFVQHINSEMENHNAYMSAKYPTLAVAVPELRCITGDSSSDSGATPGPLSAAALSLKEAMAALRQVACDPAEQRASRPTAAARSFARDTAAKPAAPAESQPAERSRGRNRSRDRNHNRSRSESRGTGRSRSGAGD